MRTVDLVPYSEIQIQQVIHSTFLIKISICSLNSKIKLHETLQIMCLTHGHISHPRMNKQNIYIFEK